MRPGRPRKHPLPAKLPNRIREHREARDLSLRALGRLAGIHAQNLARYETERDPPLPQLRKIARALGVGHKELLHDEAGEAAPRAAIGLTAEDDAQLQDIAVTLGDNFPANVALSDDERRRRIRVVMERIRALALDVRKESGKA